jgi:hypothetical protein
MTVATTHAQISDDRLSLWNDAIPTYLEEVEQSNSESARSHRFAMLMQQLMDVVPGTLKTYTAGIETQLKIKDDDLVLRGKADNLFGNVVIEFERKIPQKRAEAEEQLQRYVAILWSHEAPDARTPYLGIATDGVRFIAYTPVLTNPAAKTVTPAMVQLQVLEETDWTRLKPQEVFYWLDRYFLRQEVLHPTSETIVRDFGARSHAFKTATHALYTFWQGVKKKSAFAVVYESWEKYLRIVYGSDIAGDELFMRHTYLATLAKVMAWMRITESASLPTDAQIAFLLEGDLFKRQGIENFIEEDFFSWLARAEAIPIAVDTVRRLFSLLQNYNLRELSEDVLKSLYQELVDPETRHDLGEYYTPDWLAHRVVNHLLDANPSGTMLDPSCGSGTFLYLAVREKRERLGDSPETLAHILDAVYGADIHPLAVIVAKTNYILALGDALRQRTGPITIPIYLTDMIRLPEWQMEPRLDAPALPSFRVELDGKEMLIPAALLKNVPRYDQAIELARAFAVQNRGKQVTLTGFQNFLLARRFVTGDHAGLDQAMFEIAATLKHFIDIDRDSIWAFVLKNIYRPLFLKRRFDFIMGNPPWLSFRYTEPTYQKFLKRQIVNEYGLLVGGANLITHLELATLFLVRAADLYLKHGGEIAFVLPRSLFSADQHDGLRRRSFKLSEEPGYMLFWKELWDCEGVSPLFSVPTCVLFGEKRAIPFGKQPPVAPIAGVNLTGRVKRKNASLAEAALSVKTHPTEFSLFLNGKRSYWATEGTTNTEGASAYKKKFAQGATIVPRSFWFVRIAPSPLGFDPNTPPVETDPRAIEEAKAPYKDVRLAGNIERRFLYATLLSTDLVPFGHLPYRMMVQPIEPHGATYRLLDADEARKRGYYDLAKWLDVVQREWAVRRSEKSSASALEWLNYRKKLTEQSPQAKYRVLYNKSGTNLTVSVISDTEIVFAEGGQQVKAVGFVADHNTYLLETDNINEAQFVGAILNAPIIDTLVKPMQARGLFGPRDIHKKVLELPIPLFDPANDAHVQLATIGERCHARVATWVAEGGEDTVRRIGAARGVVRQLLADDLSEIDGIVRGMLGIAAGT